MKAETERTFGADIQSLTSVAGLIDDIIEDWTSCLDSKTVRPEKELAVKNYIEAAKYIKEKLAWLILELDHEYDEYYKSLGVSERGN